MVHRTKELNDIIPIIQKEDPLSRYGVSRYDLQYGEYQDRYWTYLRYMLQNPSQS